MRLRHLFLIAGSAILAMVFVPGQYSTKAAPPPAANYRVIYSFQGGTDGANPYTDLVADAQGNLYGTTLYGGAENCGTVFELKQTGSGWQEQVLYSFPGGTGGAGPGSGLTFDKAGNLYGYTVGATCVNYGEPNVFKLSPDGKGNWKETSIYKFSSAYPKLSTDLAIDSSGNLFGISEDSIFELAPGAKGGWKFQTLYTFQNASDGGEPSTTPVFDPSGNLWGAAALGGPGICHASLYSGGCGIVYELSPGSGGTWTENVAYNFARGGGRAVTPSDGAPSGFILQKDGSIVATSAAGGNGLGTVFALRPSQKGLVQIVQHRFYGGDDGAVPIGRIINTAAGSIFGVTTRSSTNLGTVYQIQADQQNGWRDTVLHRFAGGTDGSYPQAGLLEACKRHLYGTTSYGGSTTACNAAGCGTVYEIVVPDGQ
ncbi:MAG TPA: choice-of-anchor tandem repeat GloVer-containing protein [Terriglobales bacterium]